MSRRFVTLDVFTTRPHAGNPLAVVLDSEGLDTAAMQAIAREFNLSETVFVAPPADPAHRAAIRIFTPGQELPFAGHPTVGTAALLALRDAAEGRAADRLVLAPCRIAELDLETHVAPIDDEVADAAARHQILAGIRIDHRLERFAYGFLVKTHRAFLDNRRPGRPGKPADDTGAASFPHPRRQRGFPPSRRAAPHRRMPALSRRP